MKKKYPLSMFIMGVILELFKRWYILVLAILSMLIRAFHPYVSITIPFILLMAWLALAINMQLKYKRELLSIHKDKEQNDLLDKMFIDNGKGYRNVIEAVNEIINKNKYDS